MEGPGWSPGPRGPVWTGAFASATWSQDGAIFVVGDVRIDAAPGVSGRGGVQELADLWSRHGPAALDDIVGDYSVCVFDGQNWSLARDALGVRPAFYGRHDGGWFCTDGWRAPGQAGILPWRPDEAGLANLVVKDAYDATLAPIAGVRRLMPGHVVRLDDDPLPRRHWHPPQTRSPDDRDEAVRRVRELVQEAVRCRIPEGRAAAQLSGGLDSGAVVATLRRLAPEPPLTFSFELPEGAPAEAEDESEQIRRMARHDTHQVIHVAAEDYLPPGDPLEFADRHEPRLLEAARQAGATTLFSGWGGDQFASHGGTRTLPYWVRRGRWLRVYRYARQAAAASGRPAVRLFANLILRGLRPATASGIHLEPPVEAIAPLLKRTGPRRRGYLRRWRRVDDPWSFRFANALDPPVALRCEREGMQAAAFGMHMEYPLLDRRLVEYALTIPPEHLFEHGRTRVVFREAMRPYLPNELVDGRAKGPPPWGFAGVPRAYAAILRELDADRPSAMARDAIDIPRYRTMLEEDAALVTAGGTGRWTGLLDVYRLLRVLDGFDASR